MRKLSAILLAAGFSKRAESFKPLMRWHGQSFLANVYTALEGVARFEEILVVTGHRAEMLGPELNELGARSVFNENFHLGIHASIRTGLSALTATWNGALIAHVDQPQLSSRDYRRIAEPFLESSSSLVRPTFKGESGNPAIISREYLDEVLAEPDRDSGCQYLFQRHAEECLFVEMENDGCLIDFDIRSHHG